MKAVWLARSLYGEPRGTLAVKDARMELKTTKETKELLSKAAILDGMDLFAFMLASAIDKARVILGEHALITLSAVMDYIWMLMPERLVFIRN